MYKGTIVLESLLDDRVLNELKVIDFKVTKEDNPSDRWHLLSVEASLDQIDMLSKYLKTEKWYAHFWKNDDVAAIFPGKTFTFKHSKKDSWKDAIAYGFSLGIPKEQLDFVIER